MVEKSWLGKILKILFTFWSSKVDFFLLHCCCQVVSSVKLCIVKFLRVFTNTKNLLTFTIFVVLGKCLIANTSSGSGKTPDHGESSHPELLLDFHFKLKQTLLLKLLQDRLFGQQWYGKEATQIWQFTVFSWAYLGRCFYNYFVYLVSRVI